MSNLNKLLAYSMCEEMEYNLFNDEECVATDIIGDIEDEPSEAPPDANASNISGTAAVVPSRS